MDPPELSVIVDLEAWPQDAARFLASLARHRGTRAVEVVMVDRRAEPEPAAHVLVEVGHGATPTWDGPATHLAAPPGTGFGAALDLALAAAAGDAVLLVDTSLELTGDLVGDLVAALDDPTVAVAGPYGLLTADLCDYEERTTGDVAAIQGYCLAARRADLLAAGGVGVRFVWYRNADIDVSLRLRTLTDPTRRAVAVGAERCTRHIHRAWEATPEAQRGELSRHNMGIVHEVFFDRKDLTVT